MPSIDVYNIEGKKVKSIDLKEEIFGIEPNEAVVHSVLVNYLANQRQGTQSTKTRAEVRGGGRKPWRQKGTGRARQGSIRAPQWIKGGIALGPKPRSYKYRVNKKEKRLAIKSLLSSKVLENNLVVVDKFELKEIKTKTMATAMKNLKVEGKALIVLPDITKLNLANDLRAQAESLVARAAALEEEGKETKLTEEEAQERAGLDTRISKLAERLTKDEEARNAEKEVQGLQISLDRIVEDRTNTEGQISGLDEKIAELDKLISGLDDVTRAKIEEAKRRRDELVEQRKQANEELTKLDSIVVLADATKLSQAEEFRRQAEELLRQADVLEQEGQGNELTEEQLRAKVALELRIQKIKK